MLAALSVDQESYREAARLFAAAQSGRRRDGSVMWMLHREAYQVDVAKTREMLGSEDFDAAWAEGAAMSLDEAIAYARRGRGERKRPSTGWASLTPAELQVVDLVAEGLRNAQVAERLFISRHTVESHLKHVFTKLGVSTRTELARETSKRRGAAASEVDLQ